jgi:hypothetical protein
MLWPLSLFTRDRVTLGRVGFLPYAIPNWARDTHVYCIGQSGTGKSKWLEGLFVDDVRAGRGCGLIDPTGDLAHDVLANLLSSGYFDDPKARRRVIYFDPARTDYTLEFNVLQSRLPAYTLANQVIEAFRRTWPQSLREAPRFTNIALAALLALIEARRTLVDMPQLLTDATFREQVLDRVRDPQVVDFFHSRYDNWGWGFTVESVLNKASAFTLNPHLRHCLGTAKNGLDLRHIMDSGQVLIVDLGHCDDETRRLIGSLISTGFEQAALTRANERRHFYLYLDEFQEFTANDGGTQTLAHILSQCRKYNLHLLLAHQTLGQIQSRVESALGNVNVKVAFRLDYEDARALAHKLFVDYVGALNSEEATALIQKLPWRTALVKWSGERLAKMRTRTIPPYRATDRDVERLMTELARTHGVVPKCTTDSGLQATSNGTSLPLSDWET